MPFMCDLPGVVGCPKVHATTPPSINTEMGALISVCMPPLHDFNG